MAHQFDGALTAIPCGSATDIDNIWAGGATWSGWFNADGWGGASFGRLTDKQDGNSGGLGWLLFLDETPDRVIFIHSHALAEGVWGTPSSSIALGTWYHFTCRWDKNVAFEEPVFTLQGAVVATTEDQQQSGAASDDSSHEMWIGNRIGNDRQFNGRIADVRLYNRKLSDDEVLDLYTLKGSDSIVRGLVRRFPMRGRPGFGPRTPFAAYTETSNNDINVLTVNVPAGTQNGDLLVIIGFTGGTTSGSPPTFTTPSGWVSRVDLPLPSTATTPRMTVMTRTASSEPASYALFASETSPMVAYMLRLPGVTNSVDVSATTTGTSASPSSPTATATTNVFALYVMAFDNDVQLPSNRWDIRPGGGIPFLRVLTASNGTENGGGLAVSFENRSSGATGAKTWTIAASDQWGGITICFPAGQGLEGAPIKDWSDAQDHGGIIGPLLAAEDILAVEGF